MSNFIKKKAEINAEFACALSCLVHAHSSIMDLKRMSNMSTDLIIRSQAIKDEIVCLMGLVEELEKKNVPFDSRKDF